MAPCERPRVLMACGYFDWFSGYQEIGLARALREVADVEVLAGDRVNPIFSDSHLARIGISRRYPAGARREEGVVVRRIACREWRSMVWSNDAISAVADGTYDHVVQVMPGQGLPLAASLAGGSATRSVLYGDNAAMYAGMPSALAAVKFCVFAASKGQLYRFVNSRADRVYGYTPATVARLRRFTAGRRMGVLPLAFDERVFAVDHQARRQVRDELGFRDDQVVLLAPGKIRRQKRFELLVDVVLRLRADGHQARLLLVGVDDGEEAASLLAHVARRNASDCVTALPLVPPARLNHVMNAADLGVWPAMPAITIQQAMGTGLRVLVPDNDLVGHLVSHPVAGALFDPEPSRLGESLYRCLLDELDQASPRDDRALRHRRREHNNWLASRAVASQILSPRPPANG